MKFFAEYSANAPDELYTDLAIFSLPAGKDDFVFIHICYTGPENEAEKYIDPIRKAGTPVRDGIKAVDYVTLQASWDATDPRATGNYIKSGMVTEISDEMIDTIMRGLEPHPARTTEVYFQHGGGAIGRVPADATAFAQRYVENDFFVAIAWPANEDRDPHVKFIKDYWSTLEPLTRGLYVNNAYEETQTRLNKNYASNYERLVRVKNKYDPGNLFRLNANIVPSI
jgi:hypothetical protein